MLHLRETQVQIKQQKKIQNHIVSRCRNVLRTQENLLCQSLQQIKRRKDSGEETAAQIWSSLFSGIIEKIPPDFFYGDDSKATSFQDMTSLEKLILQEVALQLHEDEDKKKGAVGGFPLRELNLEETMLQKLSLTVKAFEPICHGVDESELEEEPEKDKLLSKLVHVLKAVMEKTDIAKWDWKEEDADLKQEVQKINEHLTMSLTLIGQLEKCTEVTHLMEALKSIHLEDTDKVLKMLQDADVARGSPDGCSSCDCDYSEEEDCDDYEDEEEEEEEDFCVEGEVTGGGGLQGTLSVSLTIKKKGYGFQEHLANADLDAGDEGYIVRHGRSKKSGGTRTKVFGNPQCDHVGCPPSPCHYRDWKRDGFRCICGQKFRLLGMLDKHIQAHHEARVQTCGLCEYKTTRKCCLEMHKKENHDKPKMLRCSRRLYHCMYGCDEVFKTKKQLFDHQKETNRQCKNLNTLFPPRRLPPTPLSFVNALKITCERANITLTVDVLEAILSAAEKDAEDIRNSRE